jgi:prevent-host-death family protein
MPIQMNIADAKAKLSALVEAAERGEEVILARGGKPVARIAPLDAAPVWRPRHWLKELGASDVSEGAFEPDPADAAAAIAPLDPDERR